MKKIIYYLIPISLLIPVSLYAEIYCFVKNNGDLECIHLKSTFVETGVAGGGGCGGNSACGNNNRETDWIAPYINKHLFSTEDAEKFQKIFKEYENQSIQLEITPAPILR